MASTIITKNSSTASAVPVVGDLTKGELAVNVTDKKIYTKDNSAAVVKLVGSLGNQEANAVAITGGSIAGITDLAVADGGTGASTASDARTNLGLGTIATQAASSVTITGGSVTGITDITVADGGTGASTAANARTNLGAAASGANSDITSLSGLTTALSVAQGGTGITSFGSGVATFLGTPSSANLLAAVTDETGTGALVFATSPTLVTPALGTPSALVGTNITGTASGLTAGNVTTNANLTGAITSVGNATSLGSFSSANLLGALTDETGTGSAVFATSPTLVTPILGTPTSATLTNATGLPISTGVSGLGTGVATALAVNVGSAGAPVVNGGALGTPSSGTVTNLTGTASININGTVGATTANTGNFTTLTTSSTVTLNGGTANGVTYLNGSKVLTSGSALTFDGTNFATTGKSFGASFGVGTNLYAGIGVSGGGDNAYWRAYAVHIWQNATDPNAATTGTELMRLTSTGLGIGTSSPISKLHVNSSGSTATYAVVGNSNGGSVFGVDASGVTYVAGYASKTTIFGSYNSGGSFQESARIDSSGNLLVGSTTAAGRIYSSTANNQWAMYAENALASGLNSGVLALVSAQNSTNNSYRAIVYYNAGAGQDRFLVQDSGNVQNINNSYGAISDIKLKENIVDATPKLADLMQVKVRNYNLKSDPDHKQIGVVAQELETVFPSMVDEETDRDREGNDLGTTTKSVKYSVFVPMLIKAIQELKAEFDAYKSTHP